MNLIVLILFWKGKKNLELSENKSNEFEKIIKKDGCPEDVSITYSAFINQIGSHFWWWFSSSVSLFSRCICLFLSANDCRHQKFEAVNGSLLLFLVRNVISEEFKFCTQANSRLLSSIKSNYVNVRHLHVQSSLSVLNERMTIDFQEEQKPNQLHRTVSN